MSCWDRDLKCVPNIGSFLCLHSAVALFKEARVVTPSLAGLPWPERSARLPPVHGDFSDLP